MSDEQAAFIRQLQAEQIAVGKVLGDVVHDLEAEGHADMAARVRLRADQAAYLVPLETQALEQVAELERLRRGARADGEYIRMLNDEAALLRKDIEDLQGHLAALLAPCMYCDGKGTAEDGASGCAVCHGTGSEPCDHAILGQLEAIVESWNDAERNGEAVDVEADLRQLIEEHRRRGKPRAELDELQPPGTRERIAARLGCGGAG